MAFHARRAATRGAELLLGVSGLAYAIFGDDRDENQAKFLLAWNLVAMAYLVIGGRIVRRQRHTDPNDPIPIPGNAFSRKLSFFLTVAASVTGLSAALGVLTDDSDTELAPIVRALAVLAMVLAWMLLHVGYSRFYSFWTGWRFPSCPHPGPVDFLYFSFTVGVSFAASDVEIHHRAVRWHVMVHAVVSFFYNAIVLAVAVGIITGK